MELQIHKRWGLLHWDMIPALRLSSHWPGLVKVANKWGIFFCHKVEPVTQLPVQGRHQHITVARGHGGGSNTASEVLFDHKFKFNFTQEGRGILFRFMVRITNLPVVSPVTELVVELVRYNAQKQRQKQGVWAQSIYSGSNFEDDRSKIELGESLWFQGMKWACTRGFSKKWHETQVPFPLKQLDAIQAPIHPCVAGLGRQSIGNTVESQ
ncbi:hypothetical protein DFH08DRAFT_819801 [Mycena albidolilacea]|uniref:Uncharacterized protein n=1 Tax=Mycena albidolilacea TaxID=1033008 RepID=A0AAD6ZDF8_9AGAR|nr:hypothetical protein DFH08DRAFT_819801 [Mycena albidolilacea]